MAVPPAPGWVGEFRSFIAQGNVMDLAVGVIIGAAFGSIVSSLVADIINPIIGVVMGGVDFTNVFLPLNGKHYDTLKLAKDAGAPTVNIGVFINAVINFAIIAMVIFWMVRMVNRMKKPAPGEAPAPPPATEVLLTEIRDLLKK